MNSNIWEGTYSRFEDVPVIGKGYNGSVWLEKSRRCIKEIHDAGLMYRESLLPFLVTLTHQRDGKLVVLDLGGNLGGTYFLTRAALSETNVLSYHIVETAAIVREGKKEFSTEGNLHFHSSLPKDLTVNIVYSGSTLQYIHDWKKMLTTLCTYGPSYILLDDVPAGNIPTFATAQCFYDSRVPYWFFNREEIVQTMKKNRYGLVFSALYYATILGKEQPLPMENFPADQRLSRTCHLLFAPIYERK